MWLLVLMTQNHGWEQCVKGRVQMIWIQTQVSACLCRRWWWNVHVSLQSQELHTVIIFWLPTTTNRDFGAVKPLNHSPAIFLNKQQLRSGVLSLKSHNQLWGFPIFFTLQICHISLQVPFNYWYSVTHSRVRKVTISLLVEAWQQSALQSKKNLMHI